MMFANARSDDEMAMMIFLFIIAAAAAAATYARKRWVPSSDAHGTAAFLEEPQMKKHGLFGGRGLILGRTFGGKLIRVPRYVALVAFGGAGSGKGIGLCIPNLLTHKGSAFVFDTKGDLHQATADRRRKAGNRIIRLAPWNGGADAYNPLDEIRDGPFLIDDCKALAESLVAKTGMEHDPFWGSAATSLIAGVLILVLREMSGPARSLPTLLKIIGDAELLAGAADKLRKLGGNAAVYGSIIQGHFEKGATLSKTGQSVVATAREHLSWATSDLIGKAVTSSTFSAKDLLRPDVTLYLQVPPDMLAAANGYLRCVLSTLLRTIGREGDEKKSEVLFLLDEAAQLSGLSALEQALVVGRASGCRLFLAYQSVSQAEAAFKDKPTLLLDNADVQVFLCPPTGYETAERVSKILGEYTQCVEGYSTNEGENWSSTSGTSSGGSSSSGTAGGSSGSSLNYSVAARALLKTEEILTLPADVLIATVRGLPGPIIAKRISWYSDWDFNPAARGRWPKIAWKWLIFVALAAGLGVLLLAKRAAQGGPW